MKKILAALLFLLGASLPAAAQFPTPIPSLTGPQDIATTNATINGVINNINQFYNQLPYVNFATFAVANGCYAGGQADCSAAMNAAIAYQASISQTIVNHVETVPCIAMGPGKYKFVSAWTTVNYPGFCLHGNGEEATGILWNGIGALLSIETFSANPSSYFISTDQYEVSDLTIYNDQALAVGSQIGTAIQDNGSGGGTITNVKFYGMQYGFAGAYGCDFMKFYNPAFERNDFGAYFGPGCQQIAIHAGGGFATFYANLHGLVLEGIGEGFDCFACWFVDDGSPISGNSSGEHVQIRQNVVGEMTLLGVTIKSNPAINTTRNFWGGQYESNAHGGNTYQPLFFFRFTGDFAADALRGLYISHPTIIDGGSVVSGSAFIGSSMTGGVTPRLIELDSPNLQGAQFAAWFNTVGGVKFKDLNVVSGTSLIPLQASSAGLADMTTYVFIAEPTTGYWVRGKFVNNSAPTISTGTAILGWERITDGTTAQSNVDGTDWLQIVGHNS